MSQLVLFARTPELGQVKTRLAAELGARAALRIYRALGRRAVNAASAAACRVRVAYTPDDGAERVRHWLGVDDVVPQGDGVLGERLSRAMHDAFAGGASRLLIVGSDCPAVSTAVIDDAFARLDAADVVLGPASDGGYYLIGMTRPRPELFAAIPWSCAETGAATRAAAARADCRVAMLDELDDVDTADDWRRWRATRAKRAVSGGLSVQFRGSLSPDR